MKLPFYISKTLRAYFTVASEDRRALLNTELFNTDPLSCKKEYLPLLAVEAGVEIDGFAEPTQRELIANAFKSFAKAGTVGALKDALSAIGDVRVKEDSGYFFDLDLSNVGKRVTLNELAQLRKIAQEKKNVRSVFRDVEQTNRQSQTVAVAGGMVSEAIVNIPPVSEYVCSSTVTQQIAGGMVCESVAYFKMKE